MSKVASIAIWGFESHVETQLTLAEGLTVITGPSDSGKTSIMRAIRWVATGEPSGEEFLHTKRTPAGEIISQAEEVGVHIKMTDGREVKKVRRKGKTKYWATGFEEPFEKAEVPEIVKEILGIRSTVYGRDAQGKPELEFDLNFAYQLDPPFLISQPASAGAKVLGKLAGTEAIDQALKSVSKDTYAARTEKAAADKEYERKVMQLLDYTDLDDVKETLDAAEYLAKKVEEGLNRKESILDTQIKLDLASTKLREATETLDKLSNLPAIEVDLQQIEKAQQRYDTLLSLYEVLGRTTATVKNLTQQLSECAGLEPAAWTLGKVTTAVERREAIQLLLSDYTKANSTATGAKEIILATKDLDLVKASLSDTEEKQKRFILIRDFLINYTTSAASQARAQKNVDYLQRLPEAEALLEGVAKAYEWRLAVTEAQRAYEIKRDAQVRAQNALLLAQDDIRRGEQLLAVAWDEAGGICPMCDQPVGTHGH